jgi:hypothetical protein
VGVEYSVEKKVDWNSIRNAGISNLQDRIAEVFNLVIRFR